MTNGLVRLPNAFFSRQTHFFHDYRTFLAEIGFFPLLADYTFAAYIFLIGLFLLVKCRFIFSQPESKELLYPILPLVPVVEYQFQFAYFELPKIKVPELTHLL